MPSGAATLTYYNWQQVTLVFNGTDTYTMGDGTPVSITCNVNTPCQLVVKVQVPDSQVPGGQVYKHFAVVYSS